jgi:glycine/D-amino acid oxidase-like deaminating enzyme
LNPNNLSHYDVIVIGGGPMGLSTAYHLSKRQMRTLVLERFTFFNQLGSSAGVSRQFRIP